MPPKTDIIEQRKARARQNEADEYRARLDLHALYRTNGGFQPSGVPDGAGPPYRSTKNRRPTSPPTSPPKSNND